MMKLRLESIVVLSHQEEQSLPRAITSASNPCTQNGIIAIKQGEKGSVDLNAEGALDTWHRTSPQSPQWWRRM